MNKQKEKDNDPIQNLMEWQDHRYDPGHFTGGNIHPILKGRRPNKYGYFLILVGVLILLLVWLGSRATALDWYAAVIQIALAVLVIVAGLKLLKKPGSRRPTSRRRNKN